jgi:hypothetical protein
MTKTLLINESQKKLILTESVNRELTDIVKKNYEFVKKVISVSSEQIKLNLEFLLTWGASIGGFVGPLNDFIVGKYPNLSDIELSLIITGVIMVYFTDNKKMVKSIIDKINQDGLTKPFKELLNKGEILKTTFLKFISSLNLTLHKVTNIMSYSFIIPLIPMLYESILSGVITSDNAKEIALRIGAFGLLTVSGVIIRELFIKLINRFQKSDF